MEKMRREGFEMTVSPPKVLFKEDSKGKTLFNNIFFRKKVRTSRKCQSRYRPQILLNDH